MKLPRFSLLTLLKIVGICAAEALAYSQLGAVEWLAANSVLGTFLVGAWLCLRGRWKSAILAGTISGVVFAALIPTIPPVEAVQAKAFTCIKCGSTQYSSTVFLLPAATSGPRYRQRRDSSGLLEERVEAAAGADNCPHSWTFKSGSTRYYCVFFGIRWVSRISTAN